MAVNVLLSFAFFKGIDLRPVRQRLRCGRMLIDSGAFTANSTGKKIGLLDYAAFLKENEGAWDHAITLDKIGDPAVTRQNTRRLHDMGIPVIPVFTAGERLAEFDAMVRDWGYVMVGGGVGMAPAALQRRIGVLQHRAQALGGGIHALGMGAMPQLRICKPYSADSSNVGNSFRYGVLRYWDGRLLANVRLRDKAKILRVRDHLAKAGFDLPLLMNAGRMPGEPQRTELMTAMALSFAAGDEALATNQVPAPRGVADSPGTHLYSAVIPDFVLEGTLRVVDLIHSASPPPVYAPFQAGHICHEGPAAA